MELLAREKESYELVKRIGIKRANRILDSIVRRFERRYKKTQRNSMSPLNPGWIRETELEITLKYKLKQGIALNDNFNTPAAAKKRIQERIARRNSQIAKRKAILPA